MEINVIKENNGCKLLSHLNRVFILVPYPLTENSQVDNYINLNIREWNEDSTIIELVETDYAEDLFLTISNKVNEETSLIKIIDDLSELYLKFKSKYLKFRGDLTEAMFLAFVGGKSINDGETFDIEYNGEYIEVKSFSRQKKTIIISVEQLMQSSKKFAIPVVPNFEGYSIIELANIIKNENPKFSNYLINKYSKDKQLSDRKFEKHTPIDITEQLKSEINLSKNIVSGKLEIYIEV